MDVIYDFSGGIPRLINVICDRSLLNAFVWETRTISDEIAQQAEDEINGRKIIRRKEPEKIVV